MCSAFESSLRLFRATIANFITSKMLSVDDTGIKVMIENFDAIIALHRKKKLLELIGHLLWPLGGFWIDFEAIEAVMENDRIDPIGLMKPPSTAPLNSGGMLSMSRRALMMAASSVKKKHAPHLEC